MDYSGINYDYNDNVYLVSNMKPETATDPAAPGLVPGASALQLEFDAAVAGTLADKDGQGTGFRSTQPNERDVTVGSDSYLASLLDLDTTAGGSLRVTSSGTATEGTNGGNDNTLVNGLRLPFDGTGDPFSVAARIAGPVTQYDEGSEQAGVQLGNDQDNFVKVAVIEKTVGDTTGPAIEFLAEQGGTGTTIGTPRAHPDPGRRHQRRPGAARRPGRAHRQGCLPHQRWRLDRAADRVQRAGVLRGQAVRRAFRTPACWSRTRAVSSWSRASSPSGSSAGNATGGTPAAREALLRLDTGSSTNYTDSANNVWAADTGRFTPTTAPNEGVRTDAIAGTTEDPLYATYRGNIGAVTPAHADLHAAHQGRDQGRPAAALRRAGRRQQHGGQAALRHRRRGRDRASELRHLRGRGRSQHRHGARHQQRDRQGRLARARAEGHGRLPRRSPRSRCSARAACPVDTTAPAAPTGLTADGTQAGVTLDWDDSPATDLVGYRVYRSASAGGTFTELTSTPLAASTYVDTTAPANTEAFYRVVAIDTSDNVSAPSSVVSATRPVPVQQPVRINTGGPAQTVNGTTWSACSSTTACSGWVSGGNAYSETDTVTGLPAGTNNTMFQSEWTGTATTGQRAFGFAVPVTNGAYRVRLHFAELNKTAANTRTFDVRLENTTVLSNFDIWSQAGGIDKAIVRQFPATVTDGVMTIDFIRRIENAKISAIEILPGADTVAPNAPASLTATGSGDRCRPQLAGGQRRRHGGLQRLPCVGGRRHVHQAERRHADGYDVLRRRGSGRPLLLPGAHGRHVGQHLGSGRC